MFHKVVKKIIQRIVVVEERSLENGDRIIVEEKNREREVAFAI